MSHAEKPAAADRRLPVADHIRKIAVFRALFLGDLLCATPALRELKRRFPAAEIALIGLPWAAELVDRLPYVDRFAEFPGYPRIMEVPVAPARTRAFLDGARARGYDLAIQMHGDGSVSNGFVVDLGARVSLGYCRDGDGRLTLGLPYDDEEHEVLRWLRLVDAFSRIEDGAAGAGSQCTILNSQSTAADFPITAAEHGRAADLLPANDGRPLIGLHAGAKDPARRWPSARFAALADALIERCGARIVLSGAASERELTAAVRRRMRHPALDLAGATDLGAFAAAIARLDLLVTNDTGASHIAAATGTPSVILFGPSRPWQWAPLDRSRHRPVDALELAGPAADPSTALGRLPVEPVLAACEEMLDSTSDWRRTANGPLKALEVATLRPSFVVRRSS